MTQDSGLSFRELIKTLTPDQMDFVEQRLLCRTDKEAAEKAEIPYNTVRGWSNKQDVNLAVKLAKADGAILTQEWLRRSGPKAARELADELDHKSVTVRHRAAVKIIDNVVSKPPIKANIAGADGGPMTFRIVLSDGKDDTAV